MMIQLTSISLMIGFIKALGDGLHAEGKLLILVVPPKQPGAAAPFTSAMASKLGNSVDRYSLMTYDYSHPGKVPCCYG